MNRFFWWSSSGLTYPWRMVYRGCDEHCNKTLGLRAPFGVLFIVTERHVRTEGRCEECENEWP